MSPGLSGAGVPFLSFLLSRDSLHRTSFLCKTPGAYSSPAHLNQYILQQVMLLKTITTSWSQKNPKEGKARLF